MNTSRRGAVTALAMLAVWGIANTIFVLAKVNVGGLCPPLPDRS